MPLTIVRNNIDNNDNNDNIDKNKTNFIVNVTCPVEQGNDVDGKRLLYESYYCAMEQAKKRNCESVTIPLTSFVEYGFPNAINLHEAVRAIGDYMLNTDMSVSLVVFDDISFTSNSKSFHSLNTFIEKSCSENRYQRVSQEEFNALRNAATLRMPSREYRHKSGSDSFLSGIASPKAALAKELERTSTGKKHFPQRRLDDMLSQHGETFQQMLIRLIDERGECDADVYRRANVHRSVFSRIRSNPDYRPSKNTALAFAIALRLPLEVTLDLLLRAGYTLSPSNRQDIILKYYITEGIYDIFEINETLFLYDQSLLGA